jgi:hypothetical protein
MEKRFFAGKRGILHDGASYSNHFSGSASHSIFTMSTMTKDKHFRRIKESTLWLFLLLDPFSASRVLYYSLAELVIELFSVLGYPFMKLFSRKKGIFRFWIPFRRLLMNSVLAEIITLGSVIDIKRGVPRIYTNYINYDDIAHFRGPNSVSAYLMVRALDRRIQRIVNSAGDDYDIYIISDHGQVDCVPFRVLNSMKLSEFIERCAKVPSFGLSSTFEGRLSLISIAMKKSLAFLDYVSAPLRWAGRLFVKGMLRAFKPNQHEFVWKDKEQIFVSDSCSLANVYFNFSQDRIDFSPIEKKYPGLMDKLVRNRGIGIVMAKEKDAIILFGKGGKLIIKEKDVIKQGKHFLKAYGEESVLVEQLRDFNRLKFVGDLVLFGNYADGVAVSFTDHVGAHGGIGGDMQFPFFISKKKHDLSKVINARELNRIFEKY